jgi:protein translocase SecG subunit
MASMLPIIQIILSCLLIAGVLLQKSSSGIGALGGSDSVDAGFHTRRGFERVLFGGTILVAVLYAAISLLVIIGA